MASQLLGIKTRFTNDLGSPLVGGQVYTYFAGTSTNQDSYSDAALTVPNTNPVILDDTGSADIFLKGAYRIRVFDASGRFIEEQDNVTQAASQGDATELSNKVTELESDLLNANTEIDKVKLDTGITATAKFGGVDRPLSTKLLEQVSIKDLGAVGDGLTNDSQALRNANGKTVFFPKGVYLLDGRMNLSSDTNWRGEDGAIIKAIEPFAIGGFMFYAGSRNNITIDNLGLDGSQANPRGGYWFDECSNLSIKNCKVLGKTVDKTGGAFVYFKGCTEATVDNCYIDSFLSGVQFDSGGSVINITNNTITNCGHICIRSVESTLYPSSIVIDGNSLYGTGHKGSLIYMGASGNSQITGRFLNVRVSNNKGVGNYESFLVGSGNADLFSLRGIRGLRVYGNRIEGGGDLGLVIEYAEEFTVFGNDVRENEISGIVIHNAKRGTVTGNVCINNCADRGKQATKDAVRAGIRVMMGSRDVIISGNTCTDSRGLNAEKAQLYGVAVISAGTGNIEISGNLLTGNRWGPIYSENINAINAPTPLSAISLATIPMQHYPVNKVVSLKTIASGQPYSAICANSNVLYLTETAPTDSTTITVTPQGVAAQPATGVHYLGVLLDDNTVHWSMITEVSGEVVTLATKLPSSAQTGSVVKYCRFLTTSIFA